MVSKEMQENVISDIIFLSIFSIVLVGGIVFILSSGKNEKARFDLEKKLLHMSYYDSLTEVANRRFFEETLIKFYREQFLPLSIVIGDINGLKLVNDAFGHLSGDELLVTAAKIFNKSVRNQDVVSRIGGDEFAVLLPKTNSLEAQKIVNNIRSESSKYKVESIQLSISFGIGTKITTEQDMEAIYRRAEDLMYRENLLEIPSMRSNAINTILTALNEKDKSSEVHSRVVAELSEAIANTLNLTNQEVNEIKTAALLHDIGKIIVPSEILVKEGKLSKKEYDVIKGYSEIGFRILNSTHDMRNISDIVLSHHERWDGLGYPGGIRGNEIPIQSRIISIADAFDAMTSERTYRNTISFNKALEEIVRNAGTQFDPELVSVFKNNFKEIIQGLMYIEK